MNFRLHKLGYDTAKEFNKKLMKWIEEEKNNNSAGE
jgi:serine kinase of HPr protein (carbohydrate metabolism regulator)